MHIKPVGVAVLLLCRSLLADAPTTSPTTQDAFQPGLVREIYTLPRRPRTFRDAIPGLMPKDVRVAATPSITAADDLANITGNVQADYSGEIYIPQDGEYTFSAAADDAMDAAVDGVQVISDAWVNGSKDLSVRKSTLSQGWHAFKVRYFQGDGGFGLKITWHGPGGKELLPLEAESFRVARSQVEASTAKMSASASDDADHAYRAVFRSQGFFELPESEGDLLVAMLEGPTRYSEACRKDFADTIKQTNYDKLPYWHAVKVLSGYIRGWPNGQTTRGPVTVRASYTLSDPVADRYDGWHGAKRDGFKQVATIEGKDYVIFTPAADSPERENVAKGIAGLPAALRVMLNRVRVEPYGTANEFNGGGDEIWIRRKEPTPADMIDNVFAHEIGHILMNKTDCYLAWEKAVGQETLNLSQYARTNPSEDFAEFTRLYLSTQGAPDQLASLKRLFPHRFPLMEQSLKAVSFAWISTSAAHSE